MINILKQELIKMKELQGMKNYFFVFFIASPPRGLAPQRGEKIGFERRKFELTDVRINGRFYKVLLGNVQGG